MTFHRMDGRTPEQLRSVSIASEVNPYAEGSAQISLGKTKVLVSVTVEREVPKWMEPGAGGWITAEYGMLPRSTHTRSRREAASGKQGGRTLEIQRLIGRSLRQALPLYLLKGLTFRVDCDVLVADGGTRTAAVSGAWVALCHAIRWAHKHALVPEEALDLSPIAAVSVGRVAGKNVLDLCYEEDSQAEFDLNIVSNAENEIVEIQGTAEKTALHHRELFELLSLAQPGIMEIIAVQKEAVMHRGEL